MVNIFANFNWANVNNGIESLWVCHKQQQHSSSIAVLLSNTHTHRSKMLLMVERREAFSITYYHLTGSFFIFFFSFCLTPAAMSVVVAVAVLFAIWWCLQFVCCGRFKSNQLLFEPLNWGEKIWYVHNMLFWRFAASNFEIERKKNSYVFIYVPLLGGWTINKYGQAYWTAYWV